MTEGEGKFPSEISRRDFLKGAALAAIGLAGIRGKEAKRREGKQRIPEKLGSSFWEELRERVETEPALGVALGEGFFPLFPTQIPPPRKVEIYSTVGKSQEGTYPFPTIADFGFLTETGGWEKIDGGCRLTLDGPCKLGFFHWIQGPPTSFPRGLEGVEIAVEADGIETRMSGREFFNNFAPLSASTEKAGGNVSFPPFWASRKLVMTIKGKEEFLRGWFNLVVHQYSRLPPFTREAQQKIQRALKDLQSRLSENPARLAALPKELYRSCAREEETHCRLDAQRKTALLFSSPKGRRSRKETVMGLRIRLAKEQLAKLEKVEINLIYQDGQRVTLPLAYFFGVLAEDPRQIAPVAGANRYYNTFTNIYSGVYPDKGELEFYCNLPWPGVQYMFLTAKNFSEDDSSLKLKVTQVRIPTRRLPSGLRGRKIVPYFQETKNLGSEVILTPPTCSPGRVVSLFLHFPLWQRDKTRSPFNLNPYWRQFCLETNLEPWRMSPSFSSYPPPKSQGQITGLEDFFSSFYNPQTEQKGRPQNFDKGTLAIGGFTFHCYQSEQDDIETGVVTNTSWPTQANALALPAFGCLEKGGLPIVKKAKVRSVAFLCLEEGEVLEERPPARSIWEETARFYLQRAEELMACAPNKGIRRYWEKYCQRLEVYLDILDRVSVSGKRPLLLAEFLFNFFLREEALKTKAEEHSVFGILPLQLIEFLRYKEHYPPLLKEQIEEKLVAALGEVYPYNFHTFPLRRREGISPETKSSMEKFWRRAWRWLWNHSEGEMIQPAVFTFFAYFYNVVNPSTWGGGEREKRWSDFETFVKDVKAAKKFWEKGASLHQARLQVTEWVTDQNWPQDSKARGEILTGLRKCQQRMGEIFSSLPVYQKVTSANFERLIRFFESFPRLSLRIESDEDREIITLLLHHKLEQAFLELWGWWSAADDPRALMENWATILKINEGFLIEEAWWTAFFQPEIEEEFKREKRIRQERKQIREALFSYREKGGEEQEIIQRLEKSCRSLPADFCHPLSLSFAPHLEELEKKGLLQEEIFQVRGFGRRMWNLLTLINLLQKDIQQAAPAEKEWRQKKQAELETQLRQLLVAFKEQKDFSSVPLCPMFDLSFLYCAQNTPPHFTLSHCWRVAEKRMELDDLRAFLADYPQFFASNFLPYQPWEQKILAYLQRCLEEGIWEHKVKEIFYDFVSCRLEHPYFPLGGGLPFLHFIAHKTEVD